MKKIIVWTVAATMLSYGSVFAQLSTRDMDIDMQLNAEVGGVAPPTGSPAVSPSGAALNAIAFPAMLPSAKVVLGQTDKKARVYDVKGKVFWTKQGTPVQKKLRANDILQLGDTIQTEDKSSVSIAFDDSFMNAVHLPENTTATLESIEPTSIRIENGSIYSAVNGLPQGSSWKVTTPAAVAAVRGTLYVVRYQAANGTFYAATVDIPDDGVASAIDIQEIAGSQHADVPEGKEITLTQGQTPGQDMVGDLDPAALQEILDFFEALIEQREVADGYAPPTGNEPMGQQGDSSDPDQNRPDLDPTDTGVINDEISDTPGETPGQEIPEIPEPEKCEIDDRGGHYGGGWGNHHGGGHNNDWNDGPGHGGGRDNDWNDGPGRGDGHGGGRDNHWNDGPGRGDGHGGGRDNDWNDGPGNGGGHDNDRDNRGGNDRDNRNERDDNDNRGGGRDNNGGRGGGRD
ncbi:MAG TPA: FecR family protein [Candidatus Omnitrophota bacterium]|nr:FecR family protein [Candidatus Omnitrophota bacterium]